MENSFDKRAFCVKRGDKEKYPSTNGISILQGIQESIQYVRCKSITLLNVKVLFI